VKSGQRGGDHVTHALAKKRHQTRAGTGKEKGKRRKVVLEEKKKAGDRAGNHNNGPRENTAIPLKEWTGKKAYPPARENDVFVGEKKKAGQKEKTSRQNDKDPSTVFGEKKEGGHLEAN